MNSHFKHLWNSYALTLHLMYQSIKKKELKYARTQVNNCIYLLYTPNANIFYFINWLQRSRLYLDLRARISVFFFRNDAAFPQNTSFIAFMCITFLCSPRDATKCVKPFFFSTSSEFCFSLFYVCTRIALVYFLIYLWNELWSFNLAVVAARY